MTRRRTAASKTRWGRLAAVQVHNENAGSTEQFSYQYSYNTAGRVVKQRLQLLPRGSAFNAASSTWTTAGLGTHTWAVTGLPDCPPFRLRVADAGNPANYMEGRCVSYSGDQLTINVDATGGAGSSSTWIISPPGNLTGVNLDVAYTWDNEGKMTSQQYPGDDSAHTYNYQFDAMSRPASMGITGFAPIATASWGTAGELVNFNGDTRTYNSLGQLTRITRPGMYLNGVWTNLMDMQYVYTAGQNNGRVAQTIDGITGENVSYTYDAVNRLTAASTTDASWGQVYT